jgi:ABC-type Zn2+ transport system substrate-binding protein/surface adhesin
VRVQVRVQEQVQEIRTVAAMVDDQTLPIVLTFRPFKLALPARELHPSSVALEHDQLHRHQHDQQHRHQHDQQHRHQHDQLCLPRIKPRLLHASNQPDSACPPSMVVAELQLPVV